MARKSVRRKSVRRKSVRRKYSNKRGYKKSVRRKYSNKRGYKKRSYKNRNKSMTRKYKKRIYKRKSHKRYGGGLDYTACTEIEALIQQLNTDIYGVKTTDKIKEDINNILRMLLQQRSEDSHECKRLNNMVTSIKETLVNLRNTPNGFAEDWIQRKEASLEMYLTERVCKEENVRVAKKKEADRKAALEKARVVAKKKEADRKAVEKARVVAKKKEADRKAAVVKARVAAVEKVRVAEDKLNQTTLDLRETVHQRGVEWAKLAEDRQKEAKAAEAKAADVFEMDNTYRKNFHKTSESLLPYNRSERTV